MDDATSPGDPDQHEGVLDRLRDMPVGTFDPNIVGDAGPTDVPPGTDPPAGGLESAEDVDPLTADEDPLAAP